ncbi:MAG: glutamine-hydrolyzing carbamoyl-phosphate synthase small subunit [Thermoguttaceae bacterium]|nr:glutamine-hydrolyzing carbamoyl-phosphate synthase small subunit [Thermoguttaceae bacterium]MDW8077775.1 glutamine-hydrolyzing carbamoyl-phosphate synthase small subunit [Thermoguttaceae bacterium]
MPQVAKLALEDGKVYTGQSFGVDGEVCGEVCFNTSMVGYLEILTDPSYHNQIVVMTYPHIGNYGVNEEDMQSARPRVAGFVVREYSRMYSNWRAQYSLQEFLVRHGVVAIEGVDTRSITRRIRSLGAMRGVLSTIDLDDQSLVAKARSWPGLVGRDITREVMCDEPIAWTESLEAVAEFRMEYPNRVFRLYPTNGQAGKTPHVVLLDFGTKWNIARRLVDVGCRVTVVPGRMSAREILELNPDGIMLSNGPGDPEPVAYAQETIRQLLGKKPIFGICLGHELLALACGARTFKLKFGHRGANHPVMNLETKVVEITVQNHGFAVDADSLPDCLEVTHINLNDQTIEGLRHRHVPAMCVQYHPEAGAGPHDSKYLFRQFREMMS